MSALLSRIRWKREEGPLYAISAAHGLTHWYFSSIPVLLPFLAQDLGIGYAEAGFLVTVRQLTQTVANLPAGAIADMVGRRNLMMNLSLAFACLPWFVIGLTDQYWLMAICMGLIGIGNNLWHPAAIPAIAEMYPDRKGYGNALHALGASAGDLLPSVVIGFFLLTLTWRQVIVANIVPGLIIVGFAWYFLRSAPAGGHAMPTDQTTRQNVTVYLRGLKALLTDRQVVVLSLLAGFRSMTQNGLLVFLPFYLMEDMNQSAFMMGLYIGIMQLAGVVATPVGGLLSDRLGRKTIVGAGMLVSSLAIIVLAALRVPAVFVAMLAIIGFFLYATRPVMMAWAMDMTPPTMAGTLVSLMFVFQSAMGALAPILGGYIADRWGLMPTFYFLGGTILVANLLLPLLKDTGSGGRASRPA